MPDQIELSYDGEIDIALGKYRLQKNWQNRKMNWSAFVRRVSETHRTPEKYSEYMAAPKARQDEIKDVGGYVGGYLTNGRRLMGSILHRQLITLDIDYSKGDFWDTYNMLYDNAACMYSTHKHSPNAPRLRIIIPLDREVMADEYQAIGRAIAGQLDIEIFDPTTFQAERLMYWPSSSADAAYEFHYKDGPWICADEVLATYVNWKDSSEWPVTAKIGKILQRQIAKQVDPLEKPGVVGAFCRTYSIQEAIETCLDCYDPCDIPDRYTYKEGSTGAGLVVYDDKFAFSHHGTDPVSGQLCNAFDLVRIHKFGLRDEDAKEDTPSNKLPSYTAMVDFAQKDPKVRLLIGTEKLRDARDDFEGVLIDFTKIDAQDPEEIDKADLPTEQEETEPESMEWLTRLESDKNNKYYSTINNIVLILENDPAFKSNIAYDDFEKRAIARRNFPWRKVHTSNRCDRYLTDMDDHNIEHYIESIYGLSCGAKLEKAFGVIYARTKFHPVRDYLEATEWDGVERAETLFIDYMGIGDTDYARAVTRKWLAAGVARIFQPGIKFDYMPVFVGPEGLYKSTMYDKLGGQWYSDSVTTIQGKEGLEALQGVWIVEMPELASVRKADVESVKHYVSKRIDRYRVAYGKRTDNFPRQCIFGGNTNITDFLRGMSGNRRFWPLHITSVPEKSVIRDLTPAEVSQIWAEAVLIYRQGEPLYLPKEIEAKAFKIQQFHTEADERRGIIENYLDTLLPGNWDQLSTYDRRQFLSGDELMEKGTVIRDRVSAADIYCEAVGGFQKDMTSHNTKFIHDIMRTLDGWAEYKSRTSFPIYGNQKGYYRTKAGFKMLEITAQRTTAKSN